MLWHHESMPSVFPLPDVIRSLAEAVDDGLVAAPETMRSRVQSGDLLVWLDLQFPNHFAFSQLDEVARMEIESALTLDASHDFSSGNNGLTIMIGYLAHAIRKQTDGEW